MYFLKFAGAFLIPFLIMVIIEGAPLLLIELGIGQKLRQGSLGTWNMIHPSIGGIGIASTIVAFLVGLYYNVIITWCFFYLFNSFSVSSEWKTVLLFLNFSHLLTLSIYQKRASKVMRYEFAMTKMEHLFCWCVMEFALYVEHSYCVIFLYGNFIFKQLNLSD